MSSRFENQVAVITGGARGQGRSHALALAREGCSIALVDVPDPISSVTYPMSTAADLAATADEVEACGVECLTFAVDVRNLAALEEMTATVTGALGHISILVANAGVMAGARIDKMTGEQWREIIDTNLTGVFNSIRAVSPGMKLQRYGRIVVIASSLARTSAQNASAYVASKWGTVGLTKAAALDLAPFGITVNAVAPGSVLTKMVDNEHLARLFRPELDNPTIEDAMPLLAQLNPMRVALLDPEEITRVVLFLADAASSHISGAVIDVNAGSSALYSS